MKRIIILSTLLIVAVGVHAQTKEKPAYWVVETNVNQKNFSIVRLYNNSDKLVHEVKMDGVYFDVTRAKHRKMLDQLLKGSYHRPEITAGKKGRRGTREKTRI